MIYGENTQFFIVVNVGKQSRIIRPALISTLPNIFFLMEWLLHLIALSDIFFSVWTTILFKAPVTYIFSLKRFQIILSLLSIPYNGNFSFFLLTCSCHVKWFLPSLCIIISWCQIHSMSPILTVYTTPLWPKKILENIYRRQTFYSYNRRFHVNNDLSHCFF